ncbi:cell division protein FtsQ [Flavobacterium cyanobacteriorum]|uniref:Cell division protein FtsQ n=1 Tax=Flavobacterium cyanobacteriorum TaxID=2022802 RepID=A0A255YVQ9_9FLAO|nr:cell division protein FtsQ [Flavobacterium cyanobacteriorum]OYQ33261.1 cell division protein FtsQ [Flavobacterium cyanobacteriorum]
MKNIKWNDVRLVLMLGLVIFLYSFSSKRNESRKLKAAEVEFAENENFITLEKVNKLLIQNYGNVTGIPKVNLDLNNVEKRLDANPMIEKAEVFATVDGKLRAVITQKKPLARVYEGSRSYYIDYEGKEMPLSENYTARVPLVTGEIHLLQKGQLHRLLRYIYDDDFLKKNIIGLEVNPTGGVVMKNRNYDYDIFFGAAMNIEKKFSNYKAFLQDAVKDTLIEQYKTINLKFTQQVVCTKK